MRAHHGIIAAVAVTLIGFGSTLIFFLAPTAQANLNLPPSKVVSMDISEMQRNTKGSLPVQKMHDMTFVFAEGD